jgi:CheY-like chemotaxis protein
MSRHLLVVDDEADIAGLLRLLLEGAGYRVAVAGDGRAALRLLAESRYDLVLSDVMMPYLDGVGLAAAMWADPALRDIPLVLMSAAHAADHAAPHAAFVPKPFDIQTVLATVARLVGPEGRGGGEV